MNAISTAVFRDETSPLINVITTPCGTSVMGYGVGGFNPGPSILVAGHSPVATMVYDRLLQLPTLGWMRGSLNLMFLDAMEQEGLDAHIDLLIEPKPDELVFLPYQLDEKFHADATNEGYWTVLRACKSLGMIEGRGVKALSLEPSF